MRLVELHIYFSFYDILVLILILLSQGLSDTCSGRGAEVEEDVDCLTDHKGRQSCNTDDHSSVRVFIIGINFTFLDRARYDLRVPAILTLGTHIIYACRVGARRRSVE